VRLKAYTTCHPHPQLCVAYSVHLHQALNSSAYVKVVRIKLIKKAVCGVMLSAKGCAALRETDELRGVGEGEQR
jgi:hypothetical protein